MGRPKKNLSEGGGAGPRECFFCEKDRPKKGKGRSKSAETAYNLYKCTAKGWAALQEGAQNLRKTDLLKKIEPLQGKNFEEINIWYHHKCITNFRAQMNTLKQRGKLPSQTPVAKGRPPSISEKSFEEFLRKVIKERIVDKREVMTSRRLHKKFRKIVARNDNFIMSKSSNHGQLKQKIMSVFPDLQFVQANMQAPEIVFAVRSLEVEDILKTQGYILPSGVDTDSESDIEDEGEDKAVPVASN